MLLSHEKWGNPSIFHVDGPWKHYAKRNKSYRERQILYDLIVCGILKKKKQTQIREKGSGLWVPEAEVGGRELEKSDQKA